MVLYGFSAGIFGEEEEESSLIIMDGCQLPGYGEERIPTGPLEMDTPTGPMEINIPTEVAHNMGGPA